MIEQMKWWIYEDLQAYICEGDVLMAMEQFDADANAYSIAVDLDPSIRRFKSFKVRISKLEEKLIAGNLPQLLCTILKVIFFLSFSWDSLNVTNTLFFEQVNGFFGIHNVRVWVCFWKYLLH